MKYKKTILCVVVLAAATGGFMMWKQKTRKPGGPSYRPVSVVRGDIETNVFATGVVEPQNRVEVKSPIAGRVEEILVQEGVTVRKGGIVAWMSSTERAALLDAARVKGPAEVAHWADLYKPAPLVASIDGMVIARNVEPGQTVTTSDAVIVLADRLIVKGQVDETDIGMIALGQTATITLDAYPKNQIDATVDHIAYEAKTVSNVTIYEVDVLPQTVPPFMRSGMTANITFRTASRSDVLLVPATATRQEDDRTMVMTPAEGNDRRPRRAEIEIGLSDGKQVEVVSGLDEGDTVLVPDFDFSSSSSAQTSSPFMPTRSPRQARGGGR